jgi:hypothetical protein
VITGKYDGLNFGNGGVAFTYGGFTIGGNIIGGRMSGALAPVPQNGVSELAYLIGAKYAAGPFAVGIAAECGAYQGNVNLTGISQRRAGCSISAPVVRSPERLQFSHERDRVIGE